ncbi:MAG: glycosyltransferase family 4 protein [Alphaproteobacteria bacterium]|nr:glycosyltransferase family 4 protein [Alphaproteobacteria bacterium]
MTVARLLIALAGAVGAFFAVWLLTAVVLRWLRANQVFDRPNERSSHTSPTPRGGGLAVVAVIVIGWGLASLTATAPFEPIVAAALAGLALLSWLDDRYGVAVVVRLAGHAFAVGLCMWTFPADLLIFQGVLEPLADRLAAGVLWLWFVNLYNFMDGIDGITGTETLALTSGLVACAAIGSLESFPVEIAAICGGAALGFLVWNWPPARIFLGDVGSVPLGFLCGWLLLLLAARGLWVAALIMPLYYLADATITLGRRLAAGEKIWQAHARHFYQHAAHRTGGHAVVVRAILAADIALVALAVVAAGMASPAISFFSAAVVTGALLWYLARP